MKKQSRQFITKRPVIIFSVICVLLLSLLVLEKTHVTNLIKLHPDNTASGPTAEEKKKETEANADAKKEFIENQDKNASAQGNNTSQSKNIDLSARQESNGDVTVLTKLFGYPSGECHLSVSNLGKTHGQDAQVIYQPEYSSCAGFSIPLSALGKGSWAIVLNVTYNGTTDARSINLEVK